MKILIYSLYILIIGFRQKDSIMKNMKPQMRFHVFSQIVFIEFYSYQFAIFLLTGYISEPLSVRWGDKITLLAI